MKLKFLVAAVLLIGCASEPKRSAAGPTWYNRMHGLSETHLNLTPLVSNPAAIGEPRNQSAIELGLSDLSEMAGQLLKDSGAPNSDPLIAFTSRKFADQTKQAYQAFRSGDYEATKFAFHRSGESCVACHTRADRGAKDYPLAWRPQLFNLDRTQRIEFWLSNRQYSLAISEALHLAGDEGLASSDPVGWIRTIERVMMVIVRVEQSPRAADLLVKNALANKSMPFYLRNDVENWRLDIQKWKNHPADKNDLGRLRTAQFLLNNQRGGRRTHRNLIANLRASSILHELLEKQGRLYADSLEATGVVQENLGESPLAQYYFESCIREAPHSKTSQGCFARFAESVRFTDPIYGVSSAIDSKLTELRELSRPRPLESPLVRERDDPPGG